MGYRAHNGLSSDHVFLSATKIASGFRSERGLETQDNSLYKMMGRRIAGELSSDRVGEIKQCVEGTIQDHVTATW